MLSASAPVIYNSVAAATSVKTQLKRNLLRDEDDMENFPFHNYGDTLGVAVAFKLQKVIHMVYLLLRSLKFPFTILL